MKRSITTIALTVVLYPLRVQAQEPSPTPTRAADEGVMVASANTPAKTDAAQTADDDAHRGFISRMKRKLFKEDESPSGDGFHIGPFAPRVDFLSSGSGPAPILHFWAPDIGGTKLDLHASAAYSVFKYQYYDAQFGLIPHEGRNLPRVEMGTSSVFPLADIEKTAPMPGFDLYASARFRDYPREDYYGVGATRSASNRSDYRLQDGLYEGVMRFKVSKLSVMARAGILRTTLLEGLDSSFPNTTEIFTDATASGLTAQPDFFHTSVGGWLELRDEPGNPHRGAILAGSFSRFKQRHADDFDFNRVALEAREYIPLFSFRHVLALRQTAVFDDPDDGSLVPFYMRSAIGGNSFGRGFNSSSFRDDRFLALGSEYRFEARPDVELALIYEAAKVFPETERANLSHMRSSYGAGIRIKSPRRVHLRLDVLHSVEGTHVHIKLGRSF